MSGNIDPVKEYRSMDLRTLREGLLLHLRASAVKLYKNVARGHDIICLLSNDHTGEAFALLNYR